MSNATWFKEECKETNTAFSIALESKICSKKTPYQTVDIYKSKKLGHVMTIDGCIMLTSFDNFIYHEMMAHVPLHIHNNPKDILIVGGGDCGTLKEICKHNVNKVTQVEIDEEVTNLSKKYFPELCTANNDSRVELVFEDAIKWIHAAKDESLDIIIVDSTDPVGPGEGLFTENFYKECIRVLKKDGLLIHQSESPIFWHATHLKMRKSMKMAGFCKTKAVYFPLPTYPSGWWSATLATKDINCSWDMKSCEIKDLKYYTQDIHKGAYSEAPFITKGL